MPRVLGHYARDLKLFSLEEAVRKMTSLPARRDAASSIAGCCARAWPPTSPSSIPTRIRDVATFEDPNVYSEGVEYVVVNGRVVLDDGRMTDERPGRPLTRGR